MGARHSLRGVIASAAFASGDRIVVGSWSSGPLGPMNDVMWVRPDDTRVLIAPDERVARFVTAVYAFDDVIIENVNVDVDRFEMRAGALVMRISPGRRYPIPLGKLRTPAFTRWIEGPIARAVMGVNTYGVTQSGVHEWYRADSYCVAADAEATLEGQSLGAMRPLLPPLRVGVSEPPKRPSIVAVRPQLWDPSARLDAVLDGS